MIQKAGLVHFHSLRAVSMPNKVISGPRKKFDVENWPLYSLSYSMAVFSTNSFGLFLLHNISNHFKSYLCIT